MSKVRTRFAPSPTGLLHIGGLRSALFCYAWAKKQKGDFLLRIEDTDPERFVEGAVKQIVKSLKWAGIAADEGVIDFEKGKTVEKGGVGPYVQSQRLDLYKKFAQMLLEHNKAYKCFCTPVRLEQMRELQMAAKQMPKYDRTCYHLSDEEKQANEEKGIPYVIRFFVPEGKPVIWKDTVFGKMKFEREQVDDFIMIKTDGYATYNFANVVDDHLMEISHVIRGQEFLSSTAKHILVYEAFEWKIPEFVHVPWILGKNKQKLSKRHADVAVDDYREKGILPEAMINYLALLGWNPKDDTEIFSMEEFIKRFELSDIQKSGAVFDLDKMYWVNAQYIKKMSGEDLAEAAKPYIKDVKVSAEKLTAILELEKERLKSFNEISEKIAFFTADKVEYKQELLVWKKGKPEDLPATFKAVIEKLNALKDWNKDAIESALREVVDESGRGVGDIFWPVRAALTGLEASPGPHEVAEVLGKETTIKRLKEAENKVS